MGFITNLPIELLILIASYLHRQDWHSIRLTCRALERAGTSVLYKNFKLYISNHPAPTDSVMEIIQAQYLMNCIKDLDFWLHHDDFIPLAIDFIKRVPALSGLSFDTAWGGHPKVILHAIFLELVKKQSRLRRLSLMIRYDRYSPSHGFVDDSATIEILQSVQELHLHLENYLERKRGVGQLSRQESSCSAWLSPQFTSIRHLTLCFGSGWITNTEFSPEQSFEHTYFPHLEYLSLSHLLMGSKWVLNWVVKHAPTLQVLDLAFTPIQRDQQGLFPFTWTHVFEVLALQFQNLRTFKLLWFAGRVPESEVPDRGNDDLELTQGLYVEHDHRIVKQERKMVTLEDAMLLRDESRLSSMIHDLGRENVVVEAIPELHNILPDIDTSGSEWYSINDVLDEWIELEGGFVATTGPLPQPRQEG